jgi:hypothetical protein
MVASFLEDTRMIGLGGPRILDAGQRSQKNTDFAVADFRQ